MVCRKWNGWWLFVGLVGGLVVGLIVAGVWPSTPLHAVATDRSQSFAIATGPVDEMTEAIYFMDFLTGDLSAVVIGRSQAGGFAVMGHYGANVIQALKVDAAKEPRFLMVTGMAELQRGGRSGMTQPSRAVVYVAEVTTGRAVAYAIPFNPVMFKQGKMDQPKPLVPVVTFPFRTAAAPVGKAKDE